MYTFKQVKYNLVSLTLANIYPDYKFHVSFIDNIVIITGEKIGQALSGEELWDFLSQEFERVFGFKPEWQYMVYEIESDSIKFPINFGIE